MIANANSDSGIVCGGSFPDAYMARLAGTIVRFSGVYVHDKLMSWLLIRPYGASLRRDVLAGEIDLDLRDYGGAGAAHRAGR